jgi:sialate O-acetylesterase
MMIRIATALALVAPLLSPQAHASAIQYIPEASSYTLAYSLAIPNSSAFNFNAVSYAVDNHTGIANGSFSRIAYYMELQRAGGELIYAYASMDAFTNDASKIGVPSTGSGGFFQQTVKKASFPTPRAW